MSACDKEFLSYLWCTGNYKATSQSGILVVKIVQVCKFLRRSLSPGRHKAIYIYARISVENYFDGTDCLYCTHWHTLWAGIGSRRAPGPITTDLWCSAFTVLLTFLENYTNLDHERTKEAGSFTRCNKTNEKRRYSYHEFISFFQSKHASVITAIQRLFHLSRLTFCHDTP